LNKKKENYTFGPGSRKIKFTEFDCPVCEANNPYDEGFGDGDEVFCNYCGLTFKARLVNETQYKLIQV